MANNVGVFTQRSVAGPLAFGPDPGDAVFLAVLAERGPINVPTLITSFTRFKSIFGGALSATLGFSAGYEVARILFEKGVQRMYVTRIVGASALAAHVDLVDRNSLTTPEDTLRVAAVGPGVWANALKVVIADGTKANTFKLTVTDANDVALEGEVFDNLLLNAASLNRVNDASAYVRLSDLGSSTAAPETIPANGTFDLDGTQAGVDDHAPNDAAIVGTETMGVKSGLKVFRDYRLGRGFTLAPDLDAGATVRTEMLAQLEQFYHLPMFSGPAVGASPTTAISDVVSARSIAGGGYYYPRALVEDELTGDVKAIPVAGHVVADWLRIIPVRGPGKAPAGRDFRIDYVLGLETQSNGQPLIDAGVAELLVAQGVNPVYDRNGAGPRVWGGRATAEDASWQYLHAGYLWVLIASRVQEALDDLVYDVADEAFFAAVRLAIRNFLVDLHGQGAFNGAIPLENEQIDPDIHAFAVKADASLLSDQDKANGIVRVEIWFKPALVAETINVNVAKRNEG